MGRVSHRHPLREIEVHSDTEPTKSLARCYGGFKCHSVCQERRAGQDAVTIRVQNSSVHVFCQSKIVRVHDQAFHGILSVVASSGVRGLSAICSGIEDGPGVFARLAIMKCAAEPNPRKSQKSDRSFRIAATETPSLNVRPRECRVAVVVPSSTPNPKGTNEATSWAQRFADSTRYASR